mmetsp:Transcript_33753/g.78992  ORF Transcript_33753/g.78992 Transcript_33753/m.78992 type:complete len:205 (+) Transcript_33753:754-1368(+)
MGGGVAGGADPGRVGGAAVHLPGQGARRQPLRRSRCSPAPRCAAGGSACATGAATGAAGGSADASPLVHLLCTCRRGRTRPRAPPALAVGRQPVLDDGFKERLLHCSDLPLELLTTLDELEQYTRTFELRNDALHGALRCGELRHSRVHLSSIAAQAGEDGQLLRILLSLASPMVPHLRQHMPRASQHFVCLRERDTEVGFLAD